MVRQASRGVARPSRQLAELLVARLQVPPPGKAPSCNGRAPGARNRLPPAPAQQRPRLIPIPSLSSLSGEADGRPDALENPYKGLRPFGEKDAPDFFGREALTARLMERLAAGRSCRASWPSSGRRAAASRAWCAPASCPRCAGSCCPAAAAARRGHRARHPPLEEMEAALCGWPSTRRRA